MDCEPNESTVFTNAQDLRFFAETLIESMKEGHIKVMCDPGYPFEPVRLLHLADRIDRCETAHKRDMEELGGDGVGLLKAYYALEADRDSLCRKVAELRELIKTIIPYAEKGYCTRSNGKKKTHGCTGCPLASVVSGTHYVAPICSVLKWRKVLEATKGARDDA